MNHLSMHSLRYLRRYETSIVIITKPKTAHRFSSKFSTIIVEYELYVKKPKDG